MKKIKSIFFILVISITLQSCGTLKEGFKSQKKNSTDEFLVEKKKPLVMPPNYNELPEPDSSKISATENENFKNLVIEKENNLEDKSINNSTNKNTEKFILDKIKSN